MGFRQSCTIRRNGIDRYSRGYGCTVPYDVFFGPEAAECDIRGLDWEEFVWGEDGAVVVDFDTRTLLFWGNICESFYPENPACVPHLLKLMRHTWPGWTLRWAYYGMRDIIEYLDHPWKDELDTIEQKDLEWDLEGTGPEWFHEYGRFQCNGGPGEGMIVTQRKQDGTIVDYFTDRSLDENICQGPQLLALLGAYAPTDLPRELSLQATLLVDEVERCLIVWWVWPENAKTIRYVDRFWPGWRVRFNAGGYQEHIRLTGRIPTPFLLPYTEAAKMILDDLRGRISDPTESCVDGYDAWLEEYRIYGDDQGVPRHIQLYVDGAPITGAAQTRILDQLDRTVC